LIRSQFSFIYINVHPKVHWYFDNDDNIDDDDDDYEYSKRLIEMFGNFFLTKKEIEIERFDHKWYRHTPGWRCAPEFKAVTVTIVNKRAHNEWERNKSSIHASQFGVDHIRMCAGYPRANVLSKHRHWSGSGWDWGAHRMARRIEIIYLFLLGCRQIHVLKLKIGVCTYI
jgi:hypothetical protein